MIFCLVLAAATPATAETGAFVRGTNDIPAGVTYVEVAGGLAAVDLRDGSLLWRRNEGQVAIAAGGGRLLAQEPGAKGPTLVVIDRTGRVVLRSTPAPFPSPAVVFALRGTRGAIATLVWMTLPPGPSGGAPHLPGPFHWGTASLNLTTGAVEVKETGVTKPGEAMPGSEWPGLMTGPPPSIPAPFDGSSVLAAPARMNDGTIVMLRKEGNKILLYHWRDGSAAPGAPRPIAHEEPGHRLVLSGAGGESVLLWDCVQPGTERCRYELFSADGALLGISTSPTLHSVGGIALATTPDPDPKKFRLQRLDSTGKAVWTRVLDAVPPRPPPPP